MATFNIPGLHNIVPWAANTNYLEGTAVRRTAGGPVWIARMEGMLSQPPADVTTASTEWTYWVQDGADGAPGAPGAAGTMVAANTGTPTATLNTITIDNVVYNIPSGGTPAEETFQFSTAPASIVQGTGTGTFTLNIGVMGDGFTYNGFDRLVVPNGLTTTHSGATGDASVTSIPFTVTDISNVTTYTITARILSNDGNGMAVDPRSVSVTFRVTTAPVQPMPYYATVATSAPANVAAMGASRGVPMAGSEVTLTGIANGIMYVAIPNDFPNPRFRSDAFSIPATQESGFGTTGYTLWNLGDLNQVGATFVVTLAGGR